MVSGQQNTSEVSRSLAMETAPLRDAERCQREWKSYYTPVLLQKWMRFFSELEKWTQAWLSTNPQSLSTHLSTHPKPRLLSIRAASTGSGAHIPADKPCSSQVGDTPTAPR